MKKTAEEKRDMVLNENWIPKENLRKGAQYYCRARNFIVGTWDGECFRYIRWKFNDFFEDKEYHWDDGPPYGTVQPIEIIE